MLDARQEWRPTSQSSSFSFFTVYLSHTSGKVCATDWCWCVVNGPCALCLDPVQSPPVVVRARDLGGNAVKGSRVEESGERVGTKSSAWRKKEKLFQRIERNLQKKVQNFSGREQKYPPRDTTCRPCCPAFILKGVTALTSVLARHARSR